MALLRLTPKTVCGYFLSPPAPASCEAHNGFLLFLLHLYFIGSKPHKLVGEVFFQTYKRRTAPTTCRRERNITQVARAASASEAGGYSVTVTLNRH
jgi:hypothetical protein